MLVSRAGGAEDAQEVLGAGGWAVKQSLISSQGVFPRL